MNIVLKNERQKKGLTQNQISDMLRVSLRTYQYIEKGIRKPSCDVVIRLQNLYNKPIDFLLEQTVDIK